MADLGDLLDALLDLAADNPRGTCVVMCFIVRVNRQRGLISATEESEQIARTHEWRDETVAANREIEQLELMRGIRRARPQDV